jgi:hypothetical protein
LTSCCGLSFISGVRRNRTEFDYCGLFGSASAVVKPNPLSNICSVSVRYILLKQKIIPLYLLSHIIDCKNWAFSDRLLGQEVLQ